MSEKLKYPMQVGAIVRAKKTFGIDSALTLPTNAEYSEDRKMPLEMHSGFSRFVFTIIDFESGVSKIAKANIPADSVPYILKETEIAMQKISDSKNTTPENKSIAYTQKLFSKEYGGMTPADVLLKTPEKKDALLKTKEWLSDNLTKYPRNKAQIDAIDDALKLFEAGKLVADDSPSVENTIPVYKEDIKIPRASKLNENGKTFVYSISIMCTPGRNYPFAINIMNCYATPSTDAKGQITVNLSSAEDVIKNSILLSEQEWYSKITRMQKTIENFESMHFAEQYKFAKDNAYKHE